MSLREPIKRQNWESILNNLKKILEENFPYCREREMIKFYLDELYYRMWHHSTGVGSMATDLDFIEYRWINYVLKRVAFIEVKTQETARIRPRTTQQENILIQLSKDANTPLYRVTFDQALTNFRVESLNPINLTQTLNEQQMNNFIKSLR